MARKERAELVVDEDTAELGVGNEEGVMGVVEVVGSMMKMVGSLAEGVVVLSVRECGGRFGCGGKG